MNWRFWQKNRLGESTNGVRPKLSRPKDLPDEVGRHLVVDLGLDPDWVWRLKAAVRPREGERHTRDIKIFDPVRADAAGVTIKHYDSLDDHPELVLFDGSYNSESRMCWIERRQTTAKAS